MNENTQRSPSFLSKIEGLQYSFKERLISMFSDHGTPIRNSHQPHPLSIITEQQVKQQQIFDEYFLKKVSPLKSKSQKNLQVDDIQRKNSQKMLPLTLQSLQLLENNLHAKTSYLDQQQETKPKMEKAYNSRSRFQPNIAFLGGETYSRSMIQSTYDKENPISHTPFKLTMQVPALVMQTETDYQSESQDDQELKENQKSFDSQVTNFMKRKIETKSISQVRNSIKAADKAPEPQSNSKIIALKPQQISKGVKSKKRIHQIDKKQSSFQQVVKMRQPQVNIIQQNPRHLLKEVQESVLQENTFQSQIFVGQQNVMEYLRNSKKLRQIQPQNNQHHLKKPSDATPTKFQQNLKLSKEVTSKDNLKEKQTMIPIIVKLKQGNRNQEEARINKQRASLQYGRAQDRTPNDDTVFDEEITRECYFKV